MYFVVNFVNSLHSEEELLQHLLNEKRYNKLLRPATHLNDAVRIQFDLIISQLIGVVSFCFFRLFI